MHDGDQKCPRSCSIPQPEKAAIAVPGSDDLHAKKLTSKALSSTTVGRGLTYFIGCKWKSIRLPFLYLMVKVLRISPEIRGFIHL
jgi:hypothetical protein